MIEINNKSKCSGCQSCYNACPKHCIEMKSDEEGFLYPSIDTSACINCGKCEKVCPILNGKTESPSALQIGYAAYNKDDVIRFKSSSGGIFTLLAEYIIRHGGVVFGAAMTDDCKGVHHIIVESVDDLEKLRGSKYVQSSIEDTYKTAKQMLDLGKFVLFTGTPCQIGGLISYLGKEYENLYTQDIICHGVPSPLVWKEYVEIINTNDPNPQKVSFRDKTTGWKSYSVKIDYKNKIYKSLASDDLYINGFLADIYLRPSCYECAFKTVNRQSDITLADFWGINNIHPKMDDNKGTSFVWLHTQKGKTLFENVIDKTTAVEIQPNDAIQHNNSAISSTVMNEKRKSFFQYFHNKRIDDAIYEYTKKNIKQRVRAFLSKIKHKVLK